MNNITERFHCDRREESSGDTVVTLESHSVSAPVLKK